MAGVTLNREIKDQIIRNAEATVKLDGDFKDEAVEIHSEIINRWLESKELLRFVTANEEQTSKLLKAYKVTPRKNNVKKEDVKFPVIVDLPDDLIEWDFIQHESTRQATAYDANHHWAYDANHQTQPTAIAVLVQGEYTSKIPPTITNSFGGTSPLQTEWSSMYASADRPHNSPEDIDRRTRYMSLSWDEAPVEVQEAVKTYLTRNRTFQKRKKIRTDINNLLKECRTVGQFLKAFPEGEHLLPDWVIQRLHEKATPKKKKTVEFDSDLSHVKQSILINKIGAA